MLVFECTNYERYAHSQNVNRANYDKISGCRDKNEGTVCFSVCFLANVRSTVCPPVNLTSTSKYFLLHTANRGRRR